jgi:hypothetical protein
VLEATTDLQCLIRFDAPARPGIWRFTVHFREIDDSEPVVGVIDPTVPISANFSPGQYGSLAYLSNGHILINGTSSVATHGFGPLDHVTLEIDMQSQPRKVSFFVNDVPIPYFVVNVPADVQFFVCLSRSSSYFILESVCRYDKVAAPHPSDRCLSW